MKRLSKFIDDHFEEMVIVMLLSVMTVAIFYQVIMRYLFNKAPSWTEELTRYAFIWCAYFGVSLGVKRNAHISVMAVIDLLSPKNRKKMYMIANVIFLAFSVIILKLGVETTMSIAKLGRKSAALEIPMWIVYAALPVGFTFIILRLIQAIYGQIRDIRGRSEGDEEGAIG